MLQPFFREAMLPGPVRTAGFPAGRNPGIPAGLPAVLSRICGAWLRENKAQASAFAELRRDKWLAQSKESAFHQCYCPDSAHSSAPEPTSSN